ncbi:DUF4369 domain-containing protein [Plebeiibacterium sediminum]|uniref:Thioredoxin domain-containing protein n=1 Tax=Plebeiibacterium sediminum TaxID=2992112 RepID=A0AAE3M0U3_9BACT|nr:DUF4369 domain-containing protein [Plebeiobacterium sediminum]MCW3784969.1 hypothetical protein [Plebeiobacterium sediminum]
MRCFILGILLSFVLFSCKESVEQKVPVVDGILLNNTNSEIYLYKEGDQPLLLDTIVINEEGSFRIYQEKIETPAFYSLVFHDSSKINLFLKPNDFIQVQINAKDIINTCESKNSKVLNAFWKLERNEMQFQEQIKILAKDFKALIGNEENDSLYQALIKRKDSIINVYRDAGISITHNVSNEIVKWKMLNQKAGNISPFSLEKDLKLFLENAENLTRDEHWAPLFKDYDNSLTKAYAAIRAQERYSEGEHLIQLNARTNWNDSLPLNKLNAKLIHIVLWDDSLIQRNEVRFGNVSDIQKRFGARGLKTLMVAYEKDKDLWRDNISKIRSNYWHVIDTSGVASTDLLELGVRSLPFNFLVDQDGKIIGRDLWGTDLEKRVSNFLKNY